MADWKAKKAAEGKLSDKESLLCTSENYYSRTLQLSRRHITRSRRRNGNKNGEILQEGRKLQDLTTQLHPKDLYLPSAKKESVKTQLAVLHNSI